MIKPTIGRIVHYRPADPSYDENVRFAASIAKVNEDGTVNLGVDNEHGVRESAQNVQLVQDKAVPACGQCEWMPYQKGQAAKYDVTTDDLMARVQRLEDLLTSEQVGLELPPLALKSPAELPDNVTEIVKGDDIDPVDHTKPQPGDADYQDNSLAESQAAGTEDAVLTDVTDVVDPNVGIGAPNNDGPKTVEELARDAEQVGDEVVTGDDLIDSPDGTDETADATASTDDGTGAEVDDEAKVDEGSSEADAKAPGEAVA